MDSLNQNPVPPVPPTPPAPETSQPAPAPFFNVLPANRSGGSLGNVSTESLLNRPGQGGAGRSRRLWLILGGIAALALLGLAAWFGYRYFANRNTASDIAIKQPNVSQPIANVTTSAQWQQQYFGSANCTQLTTCGDTADPDRDGLTNLEEFNNKTDPNNPDSDGDGLADGDEVHVFASDPTKAKTGTSSPYTDAEHARGGYDSTSNQQYTADQLATVKANIKKYGLHQPTVTTLGEAGLKLYDFTAANSSAPSAPANSDALPANVDQSSQARLDRDTQRLETIKKIGTGLLKYKQAKNTYPTGDFKDMAAKVKLYITVATDYSDPINQGKYVYGYSAPADGQSFTLTYYSETQSQLIKYSEAQAIRDTANENNDLNDSQRTSDLEAIRAALLAYSAQNADPNSGQTYIFPTKDRYKVALVPDYISTVPKDPKTKKDYDYTPSAKLDNFSLKAILDSPPAGKTGYLCNVDSCDNY